MAPTDAPQAQDGTTPWHALEPEAVVAALGSDAASGLGAADAASRAERYGPNEIAEGKKRSRLDMLLAQFGDFMILLLIGAGILSGLIGDIEDTIVILAIVVLNALVGFVQEMRAANAIAALRRMSAPAALALRDGHPHGLPATSLVPGDIVLLEAGNVVPADLRLIEVAGLQVGEAALTGESVPVEKRSRPEPENAPLATRTSMAYKGTTVLNGRARGIVVATGMATELGRIAAMLAAAGTVRTPLQRRLTVFGRQIAIAAIVICVMIFAIGLLRGEEPLLMLLTALSLAVAAVPEALPAVVTVLLALGASRMAKAQALIRRLPAVETLGSVTTICSDKTGTLTLNEMRLVETWIDGARAGAESLAAQGTIEAVLLRALALCNDVEPDDGGAPRGDPTEIALWRAAHDAGTDKAALTSSTPRIMEVAFDSERRRMSTVHQADGGIVAFTKGAPEAVVRHCTTMLTGGGPADIDRATIMQAADAMAADGLRVLAIASRGFDAPPQHATPDEIERDLTFLGLVGLLDPPRPEARTAVATCRAAGIRPVMITGDYPVTARAIARALGILDHDGAVITGTELTALDEADLRRRVQHTGVYSYCVIHFVRSVSRAYGRNRDIVGDYEPGCVQGGCAGWRWSVACGVVNAVADPRGR